MNKVEIDELYFNLNKLILKKKFKNKFIVLFGANIPSAKTIQFLKSKNITVNAIIDNNKQNVNSDYFDVDIFTPAQLLNDFKNNAVILIASQYYNEMRDQLIKMGYKENIHIFSTIKYSKYSTSIYNFIQESYKCYKGYIVYKRISKTYQNKSILIFPYSGTGDIYIAGLYINSYLENNNINDYIIVVPSNSCKKVAQMFNLKNIIVINQKEITELIRFNNIFDENSLNITILHCDFLGTNSIFNKVRNYKKIYFTEMFKYNIFNLDENVKIQLPKINYRQHYVEELFKKLNLKKNKTVIISPYANTLINLPMLFWENIVDILLDNEFTVCTNCYGTEEIPINKTNPISFDLNDAVAVTEYAGYFIGIRSGLCDIISSSKCKKIILYPITNMGVKTSFEYYSLKNMKLCIDNIEEIEFKSDIEFVFKEVSNKIKYYFKK